MKNKEFFLPVIIGVAATVTASVIGFRFSVVSAILCGVLGAVLLGVFALFTHRRYQAIRRLNDYLSLVCSGRYELELEKNAEGELSILQNNLYKVITRLKTQNEVIEADKRYLADSLADISHQLKTPLTSVMVMSELLEKEQSEEKRKEFINIINTQCDKMSWLVQTLLKLSKLDAGTAELNCEAISVSEIIENALVPFMLTLDLKSITVEKTINEFTFAGDKNWSVEAIQNILKNCIEHTDAGGTLCIETDENAVYKRILIRDNGCGIAKEDLPHIFERFYHGKNASSDSVGIGLALSRAIFNKENAAVAVRSEEGSGTEFEIKIYKSVI